MNRDTVGDRALRLREAAGLERPEAAALCGVHRNALYKLEIEGRDNPEADTVRALCLLYAVSADLVLDGRGPWPSAEHLRHAVAVAREKRQAVELISTARVVGEG